MLFISTPSLIISLIFAVFYVANVILYAINRKQNIDYAVEIVDIREKKESYPKQTIVFNAWQNKTNVVAQLMDVAYSNLLRSAFNDNLLSLTDITSFILYSGVYWQLFSRPPPTGILSFAGSQ